MAPKVLQCALSEAKPVKKQPLAEAKPAKKKPFEAKPIKKEPVAEVRPDSFQHNGFRGYKTECLGIPLLVLTVSKSSPFFERAVKLEMHLLYTCVCMLASLLIWVVGLVFCAHLVLRIGHAV